MAEVVLEFPVPTRPLSENEKRKMAHWAQWRRRLDPWYEATRLAWEELDEESKASVRDAGVDVLVELPFPRRARRDPHNYVGTNVKSVVDALTTKTDKEGNVFEGAWPDDTPEWVTVIEPVFAIGSETVRVHLTTRED
jgi:hypothetical protein